MTNEAIQPIELLPALQRYWGWRYSLTCTLPVLALGFAGAMAIAQLTPQPFVLLLSFALTLLAALCLAWHYAWHFASLRFAHYRADLHAGEGLVLYSGVWWRSEIWVPIARLQHLDVSQGPLDRRWGMATLSLHTAGNHDHHTRIHGLPLEQAHALREQLLPRQALQYE